MERSAVAVAYSGGRDSSALLHATLGAAEALGIEVLALHVHHGLSSHADAWLAHCDAQCARWTRRGRPVRFFAERLAAPPPAGVSIEAWARHERYAALRRMALAHGTARILLAQHRRDQAETFFLQALRGAGVSGLSAMPGCIERDGILWLRPWLAWPREAIEAYVRRYRLRWIDDDSNAEPRFARNRLRLQVWPQLVAAFGGAEAALADAASRAQEAAAALAELAALDLAAVAGARGLDVAAWSALSQARRSNALRAWLKAQTGHAAAASLAARLMAELPGRRNARWPLDSVELRLYRGVLQVAKLQVAQLQVEQRQLAKRQTAQRQTANLRIENGSLALLPPARETTLEVERAGTYRLPGWGGALQITNVQQGGVAVARLCRLDLRPRSGGERFQAGPQRPRRSLKKQYQAAGIPPWQREGPLLYSEGRLIYVPGLGIDAGAAAAPREPQLSLCWVPG